MRANAFKVWSMVQDWSQLDEPSRQKNVDSLVGEGKYRKIKAQADAMVEAATIATAPDRTVAGQVDSWKNLLRAACQSGQMSEGRYDAYCRKIRPFVEWIGPDSAIDIIGEARLEGFFSHLSGKVSAGGYSATFAHELLMRAKQFISRLAELRLIPLPGNIQPTRLGKLESSLADTLFSPSCKTGQIINSIQQQETAITLLPDGYGLYRYWVPGQFSSSSPPSVMLRLKPSFKTSRYSRCSPHPKTMSHRASI